MQFCKMFGNRIFPVICVLLSGAQLIYSQHHSFRHFGPSPSPPSWGFGNDIYGSSGGPVFRPGPGVLVAGHGPPVARPRSPVQAGSRLIPFFSTSTPTPSTWPSHGPQIQRAKETSHFEYEVFPHPMNQRKPPPPRQLRPVAPSPMSHIRSPNPTLLPGQVPQELLRILAQDGVGPVSAPVPSPKPQARTDRPPLPGFGNARPTLSPNSPDFQEGFRILNDIFMENAGADLRNNLVGGSGSEISFNGNYYPLASINTNAATTSRGNISSFLTPITSGNAPNPNVEIAPAKEQIIPIPTETSSEEAQYSSNRTSAPPTPHPQMKQSESSYESYGPPDYQPGPPSHVSFMFQDPNEAPGPYNIYDEYGGPPPPFHAGGNSIVQPPPPPPPPFIQESEGGYLPPPRQKSPQNPNLPHVRNSLRSQNKNPQMAMMMPPMLTEGKSKDSPPTSEEVQRALRVLARFASQQGSVQMGMDAQQIAMQLSSASAPNMEYGPPTQTQPMQMSSSPAAESRPPQQMTMQMASSPNTEYGSPQQMTMQMSPSPTMDYASAQEQQSTPEPSSSITPPPVPAAGLTSPMQGPSSHPTTTETAGAITISDGGEESSPMPQYGLPGQSSPMAMAQYGPPGQSSPVSQYGSPVQPSQMPQWETMNNDGGYGGGSNDGDGYGGGSSSNEGSGWSSSGGGGGPISELIGAKVQAAKTLQSAVAGGLKQITGLKAGILNAGLNAIGNLGRAKGELANSLKIPIVPPKPTGWTTPSTTGWTSSTTTGSPTTGWTSTTTAASYGWDAPPKPAGPVRSLINGVRGVVGSVAGTVAQTGRAAVGIGLTKNEFVKNHFAIKGQLFTQTVSKKLANKNQYFQNVLKHVQSIFEQQKKPVPGSGWRRR